MSITSLPPDLKQFRDKLKQQESYNRLLRAAPIPSLRNWKPGSTAEDWAKQTGKREGFMEALMFMGYENE